MAQLGGGPVLDYGVPCCCGGLGSAAPPTLHSEALSAASKFTSLRPPQSSAGVLVMGVRTPQCAPCQGRDLQARGSVSPALLQQLKTEWHLRAPGDVCPSCASASSPEIVHPLLLSEGKWRLPTVVGPPPTSPSLLEIGYQLVQGWGQN